MIETARRRTVWTKTESRYVTFEWTPQADCPICKGVGMARQYRAYGDPQYHGEYYEDCERCSAPPDLPS